MTRHPQFGDGERRIEATEVIRRALGELLAAGDDVWITVNGRCVGRFSAANEESTPGSTPDEAVDYLLEFGRTHTLGTGSAVTWRSLRDEGRR